MKLIFFLSLKNNFLKQKQINPDFQEEKPKYKTYDSFL